MVCDGGGGEEGGGRRWGEEVRESSGKKAIKIDRR